MATVKPPGSRPERAGVTLSVARRQPTTSFGSPESGGQAVSQAVSLGAFEPTALPWCVARRDDVFTQPQSGQLGRRRNDDVLCKRP